MAGKMEKNIHAGHRQRVKEEFLARGLCGMPDHRVLELLLFYAIPRGDVNPLAHRLVEHFGSLRGVLQATYDQLLAVEGMGPNGAALFQLILAAAARYMEEDASFDGQIVSSWQLKERIEPYFLGQRDELALLVCLDAGGRLLAIRKLGQGVADCVQITTRKVLEAALSCNAAQVVLAHNHVSGSAVYSRADVEATRRLSRVLDEAGVTLTDHVIVSGGDMISLAESGLMGEELGEAPLPIGQYRPEPLEPVRIASPRQ